MKIIFVGSEADCSLERWYAVHLKEAGVIVKLFPAQSMFYSYYRQSIINKLAFKAGISSIYKRIERQLRKEVEQFRPEVVWIFKGMEISPSFLVWLRSQGIRSVNFNPDHPFVFSGKGSGNKNVTRSIGLYDLHFTYDREISARIEKDYGIPCRLLPFGYELDDRLYEQCIIQEEVPDICFLGNPDRQRADFVRQLAEKFPLQVYGHDWDRFIQHPNVTIFPPAYGDDFWKVLYRYRVQLNLMRVHNSHSHNMRSFEVPAAGGIGLFPDTSDHRIYFEDKKEVFLYRNAAECAELAGYLLKMSKEDASRVRHAARLRSVSSGYSYRQRIINALPILFPSHD